MVTTSNTAVAPATTTANNDNMLLYNNNLLTSAVSNGSESIAISTCSTAATLEQYRLQLYNYALNMERLRGAPYTTAAAMAAAAAYASTTTVSTTTVNCPAVHASNYTTTVQGPSAQTSYLCATTGGGIIAATTQIGRTSSTLAQCPSSNHLTLASMSLFPQRIFQPEEPKPQHSYIGLIAMAILSSVETKLVLSDIYQYILDHYPYFRTRGPGWRNSIRHNLSLNDCFIKSGRSANGKGHYWAIHPANIEDFRKGDFRRRKAQRKVRKHMGLAVDDNGTDSPSPPPALDLTSPSSPPSFQHIVMGSSTIAAAQHLAAQSFNWRITNQHHSQQPQHHTTNISPAAYMGQIFSYRPQHYATLYHNGNTQQHHQQQLVAPTSLQQNQTPLAHSIQPCISTTNVQAEVINELFSQKRKRQFDVASLLAPDYTSKRELQYQRQQYIRKHNCESEVDDVTPSSSLNDELLVRNQSSNELDIEDIDVVEASEDEDIENDYDEVDSYSNSRSGSHSHSNSHSHNDDDEAEYVQRFHTKHHLNIKPHQKTLLRVQAFEQEDDADEEPIEPENYNAENESNNVINTTNGNNDEDQMESKICDKTTDIPIRMHSKKNHSPPPTNQQLLATNQLLEQNNDISYSNSYSHHQLPINSEAHNIFGRYYGTYMAAAAARINSSLPPVDTVSNFN